MDYHYRRRFAYRGRRVLGTLCVLPHLVFFFVMVFGFGHIVLEVPREVLFGYGGFFLLHSFWLIAVIDKHLKAKDAGAQAAGWLAKLIYRVDSTYEGWISDWRGTDKDEHE